MAVRLAVGVAVVVLVAVDETADVIAVDVVDVLMVVVVTVVVVDGPEVMCMVEVVTLGSKHALSSVKLQS